MGMWRQENFRMWRRRTERRIITSSIKDKQFICRDKYHGSHTERKMLLLPNFVNDILFIYILILCRTIKVDKKNSKQKTYVKCKHRVRDRAHTHALIASFFSVLRFVFALLRSPWRLSIAARNCQLNVSVFCSPSHQATLWNCVLCS